MSKKTITRWYISAWLVWVVSLSAFVLMPVTDSFSRAFVTIAMVVSGLTTLYMWLRALIKLARQRATLYFLAILLLQFVGLGIVGMVVYALSDPEKKPVDVVSRPSAT